MGLDDELYLRKIEMEKEGTAPRKASSGQGKGKSRAGQNVGFVTCPSCFHPLPRPLASGRQVCRDCGWLGTTARPVSAPAVSRRRKGFGFGGLILAVAAGIGLGLYAERDTLLTKILSPIPTNQAAVQKPVQAPVRSRIASVKRPSRLQNPERPHPPVRVAEKTASTPNAALRSKSSHASHLPSDLEHQVRSGMLSPEEARQLAGGRQRLEALQRTNDNWPSPGRLGNNTRPIAQAYPPGYVSGYAPRPRQSVTRYTGQSAVQAASFVTNTCSELLSWGCEGNYNGQSLDIVVAANLSPCLQETGVCPGAYSKRGLVRELYSIQRKAQNIAPGLWVQILVDGQAVDLW